jgi:hypothetical protein
MFTSFGEKMVRAEEVAHGAISEAMEWIAADVPGQAALLALIAIP